MVYDVIFLIDQRLEKIDRRMSGQIFIEFPKTETLNYQQELLDAKRGLQQYVNYAKYSGDVKNRNSTMMPELRQSTENLLAHAFSILAKRWIDL